MDATVYETRLKARLEELGHRLEDIEHDLDEPMSPDFEDRAAEREGDEAMEALGLAGLQEAAMIRAALKRIAAGEFGACQNCGADIPAARLDLLPHTPVCVMCAAAA